MSDMLWLGEQSPQECRIALHRGKPLVGTVHNSRGSPVANATVYLATVTQQLDLRTPKGHRDNLQTTTNASGEFRFHGQSEPFTVVVACDAGSSEAARDPQQPIGDLIVEPWAQLYGRVLEHGVPVAGQPVILRSLRGVGESRPRIQDEVRTRTDESGQFAFPRVRPGRHAPEAFLSAWSEGPLRSGEARPVELGAGDRATISLGGEGTTVTGRVAMSSPPIADVDYSWSISYLIARQSEDDPPTALIQPEFGPDVAWNPTWPETHEGLLYLNSLRHWFVRLTPDGTFAISGVPAGSYEFAVKTYEPPNGTCLVNPIALRVVSVNVPPAVEEHNLGLIELSSIDAIRIGDTIPSIVYRGRDGQTANVGDLQDKIVLLDFWASWCAPCVSELQRLQRLHERWKADDRIVILSLNTDIEERVARDVIARRGLTYRQGFLGDWLESPLASTLGVTSLPAYVVIAPDDRIIYRGHSLEDAVRTVEALVHE